MSAYEEIAAKAMEAGPYHGVLLRYSHSEATVVCQTCGELPPTWRHGWTSDWLTLAGQAMEHSKETGHYTAASLKHYAVYGPDENGKDDDGHLRVVAEGEH